MTNHPLGRGLSAVGGGKRIHHHHISQVGHFLGQGIVVGLFARQEADVFQKHQLPRRHLNPVDPIFYQSDRLTELLGQHLSHRRQRRPRIKLAFCGSAQVRHHHHRCPPLQRSSKRRQARLNPRGGGDVPLNNRHVQIRADQHPLLVNVGVLKGSHDHSPHTWHRWIDRA